MPLNINWQQILLHLLNLVILIVGLYLLLYKPVKKFMKKREDAYKEREENTQAALDNAKAKEEEYSSRLAGVEEEVSKKREEAAKELEGVRSEKLRQVAKEADEMLDAARERARKEHDRIINGVSDDIKEIVEEAAEKVGELPTAKLLDIYFSETFNVKGDFKFRHLGYLDDGTMIVVENGRRYLGQTIRVTVTSILQTSAGRMIFARVGDDVQIINEMEY